MNQEREETIVRTFFIRRSRDRWLVMLRKPHRRAKALDALNHLSDLDSRFTESVGSISEAEVRLLAKGAPRSCYAFSDIVDLDGRVMELSDALRAAEHGEWGTILDCIPGQLAYYLGEHREQRLILWRSGAG